ncbi:MAG: Ankyrin repeat (3 copies) [Rickettsiaceae bacterium]|jgi:ankyrin repeat protein|nr:Ankyrin repeat (3 copies) [Rickettsiaceae bacterium]
MKRKIESDTENDGLRVKKQTTLITTGRIVFPRYYSEDPNKQEFIEAIYSSKKDKILYFIDQNLDSLEELFLVKYNEEESASREISFIYLLEDEGHYEALSYALERKPDLNLYLKLKESACSSLSRPVIKGHEKVVELISQNIQNRGEIIVQADEVENLILMSIILGRFKIANLLLKAVLSLSNMSFDKAELVLGQAIMREQEETIKLLFLKGLSSIILEGEKYESLLMTAVDVGNVAIIKLLLENSAYKEYIDPKKGISALTLAAEKGEASLVKIVLEAGCNLHPLGEDIIAASGYAKDSLNKRNIIEAQKNASLYSIPSDEMYFETVKALLKTHKVDLSNLCKGKNPLEWAAETNLDKVFDLLHVYQILHQWRDGKDSNVNIDEYITFLGNFPLIFQNNSNKEIEFLDLANYLNDLMPDHVSGAIICEPSYLNIMTEMKLVLDQYITASYPITEANSIATMTIEQDLTKLKIDDSEDKNMQVVKFESAQGIHPESSESATNFEEIMELNNASQQSNSLKITGNASLIE